MEYELAKELKDAGWPQRPHTEFSHPRLGMKEVPDSHVDIPTLSELIEACGEEFFRLDNFNGVSDHRWQTFAHHRKAHGFGSTPEEAVARLWLALNNNKEV